MSEKSENLEYQERILAVLTGQREEIERRILDRVEEEAKFSIKVVKAEGLVRSSPNKHAIKEAENQLKVAKSALAKFLKAGGVLQRKIGVIDTKIIAHNKAALASLSQETLAQKAARDHEREMKIIDHEIARENRLAAEATAKVAATAQDQASQSLDGLLKGLQGNGEG